MKLADLVGIFPVPAFGVAVATAVVKAVAPAAVVVVLPTVVVVPAVVQPVAPAAVVVVPAAVVFQPLVVLAAVVAAIVVAASVVVPPVVPLSSLSAFARRRLATPAGVVVATSRPFSSGPLTRCSVVWGP